MTLPEPTGRQALLLRAIEHFAQHGIGDTSLRGLASAIGTSHRMLIYHFGSREGLLAAVVDRVEEDGRTTLARIAQEGDPDDDLLEAGLRFWHTMTEEALIYGPLFFELSSHAMLDLPHAVGLRERLVTTWLDTLEATYVSHGMDPQTGRTQARLDLAVARGLLHDLLLTGDREAVDTAMQRHATDVVSHLHR